MTNDPKSKSNYSKELGQLKEIVVNLRDFIEQHYFESSPTEPNGSMVSPMIPGRFHQEFKGSWNEVKEKIDQVIKTIESGKVPHLDENGLTGKQMQLKYKICIDSLNDANDWKTKERMTEKPKDVIWYKKWWSCCKKFFRGSNIVIGSLKKCIPFAEPICECIDGVIYLSELGTTASE